MFRTVPLFIIRSFSLYTQQRYMSYRFADSLRAGSRLISLIYFWNKTTCFGQFLCLSSRVFHFTHSNAICHTGLLTACEQDQDVSYMFRTVPLSIIRSFSLYTLKWYMSYRFADSLRAVELSANLYGIYHCSVYSEKLLKMDRETVRNM